MCAVSQPPRPAALGVAWVFLSYPVLCPLSRVLFSCSLLSRASLMLIIIALLHVGLGLALR